MRSSDWMLAVPRTRGRLPGSATHGDAKGHHRDQLCPAPRGMASCLRHAGLGLFALLSERCSVHTLGCMKKQHGPPFCAAC